VADLERPIGRRRNEGIVAVGVSGLPPGADSQVAGHLTLAVGMDQAGQF
jgi:hypothetical protein